MGRHIIALEPDEVRPGAPLTRRFTAERPDTLLLCKMIVPAEKVGLIEWREFETFRLSELFDRRRIGKIVGRFGGCEADGHQIEKPLVFYVAARRAHCCRKFSL
jgi:hypothetical protein